jgi:preprotein translocase subunit SecB
MTEESQKPEANQQGAEEQQGQFGLQKIYTKDISFETPNSPAIFQEQWSPSVNMDLANSASRIDETTYEVVLSITVTVGVEDKTIYLAEIQQAGIFHLSGLPEEILKRTLATACPNILFPYAREMISDLVTRGGFPQLLLAPVNFEALFMKQQQEMVADSDHATH